MKTLFKKQHFLALLTLLMIISICIFNTKDTYAASKKPIVNVTSVKLKNINDTITINKYETKKITFTLTPSNATKKKLTWTSSNPKIVSVSSSGKIKGLKNGTSVITGTTKDGTNKTISLTVSVGQKVANVSFTNSDDFANMKIGTSKKVNTTILPQTPANSKLKWSSSNNTVATVGSKGKITAVGNGSAVIKAVTTDGTNISVGLNVNVYTPVSSVKLTLKSTGTYVNSLTSSSMLIQKGKTAQLKSTVSPASASNKKLVWSTLNANVATVDTEGSITATGAGSTYIYAYASDGTNIYAQYKVNVSKITTSNAEFFAHRGYSNIAPENSLAAIELACISGFSGVEFDIRKTLDDDFAVSHNNSLAAMCNTDVNITDLPLSEITQYPIVNGNGVDIYSDQFVPSLDEVLALLTKYPHMKAVIELKQKYTTAEPLKIILEKIINYGLIDRVIISSSHSNNFKLLRSNDELIALKGDTIPLQYLSSALSQSVIDTCIKYNANLGAKYTQLTEGYVDALHAQGLTVSAWTLTTFSCAYNLVNSLDVDAITSNYILFNNI